MNTTIALRNETRDQLKEFANKSETYDDVIVRLLDAAKQRQLELLLMDERGTITIDEAIARAKKRWQKS